MCVSKVNKQKAQFLIFFIPIFVYFNFGATQAVFRTFFLTGKSQATGVYGIVLPIMQGIPELSLQPAEVQPARLRELAVGNRTWIGCLPVIGLNHSPIPLLHHKFFSRLIPQAMIYGNFYTSVYQCGVAFSSSFLLQVPLYFSKNLPMVTHKATEIIDFSLINL